jgi:hypothetical protein
MKRISLLILLCLIGGILAGLAGCKADNAITEKERAYYIEQAEYYEAQAKIAEAIAGSYWSLYRNIDFKVVPTEYIQVAEAEAEIYRSTAEQYDKRAEEYREEAKYFRNLASQ